MVLVEAATGQIFLACWGNGFLKKFEKTLWCTKSSPWTRPGSLFFLHREGSTLRLGAHGVADFVCHAPLVWLWDGSATRSSPCANVGFAVGKKSKTKTREHRLLAAPCRSLFYATLFPRSLGIGSCMCPPSFTPSHLYTHNDTDYASWHVSAWVKVVLGRLLFPRPSSSGDSSITPYKARVYCMLACSLTLTHSPPIHAQQAGLFLALPRRRTEEEGTHTRLYRRPRA